MSTARVPERFRRYLERREPRSGQPLTSPDQPRRRGGPWRSATRATPEPILDRSDARTVADVASPGPASPLRRHHDEMRVHYDRCSADDDPFPSAEFYVNDYLYSCGHTAIWQLLDAHGGGRMSQYHHAGVRGEKPEPQFAGR